MDLSRNPSASNETNKQPSMGGVLTVLYIYINILIKV